MKLHRALAHLRRIGITDQVLAAGGVDPTDPVAVRAEVETLLHSALAENAITNMVGLAALQMALGALLTDAERADNEALAGAIRGNLRSTGVLVPQHAEPFEACLGAS